MGIGSDIGEGLAIGIEDQAARVASATRAMVTGAADEVAKVGGIGVDVNGAGAGGTFVTVAPGAVVVQLPPGSTPEDQRRVLRTASDAFWGTLADRRVTAAARLR
jgi:hypothetical protein